MRDERLQRKVWRDEDETLSKKRDETMAGLAETQAKLGESFSPSPRVKISYPGTVEHLGCIIREPDGTLKLGTNTGDLIELDANESNFLLVAMRRKPSEAKPS